MKTIIAIVALVLPLSTFALSPPPVPGMQALPVRTKPAVTIPKGAEALTSKSLLTAQRFAPASVVVNGVIIDQWISESDIFPGMKLFNVVAQQAPNSNLVLEYSTTPGGQWSLMADFGCGSEYATYVASTLARGDSVYVRGRNTSCVPPTEGFAPASATIRGELTAIRRKGKLLTLEQQPQSTGEWLIRRVLK